MDPEDDNNADDNNTEEESESEEWIDPVTLVLGQILFDDTEDNNG